MNEENRARFHTKELAIVLSYYDLGEIREIHTFRRGNPNSPKVILTTPKGRFLLKRSTGQHDDLYRIAMTHDLQLYLTGQGFPTAPLIGTRKSNQSMLRLASSVYELFTFVEGTGFPHSLPAACQAGAALRRLHDLLGDYQCDFHIPTGCFHDSLLVRESIRRVAEGICKRTNVMGHEDELDSLSHYLETTYDQAAGAISAALLQGELGICHGDFHPGNLIFHGDHVAALLDYDAARIMPRLCELANALLQFSFQRRGTNPDQWPEQAEMTRAAALLYGYDQLKDNTAQRDRLCDDGAQLAALVNIMIEALIAESVAPIAATGMFADVHGLTFLRMIRRKATWLQQKGLSTLVAAIGRVSTGQLTPSPLPQSETG